MQTFSKAIKLIVPVPTFAFVFENIPIKEAGGELLSDTLIALDKDSFTFLSTLKRNGCSIDVHSLITVHSVSLVFTAHKKDGKMLAVNENWYSL